MPHINDLTAGVLWEGNNGDKWMVDSGVHDPEEINVKLKKLQMTEQLIKDI